MSEDNLLFQAGGTLDDNAPSYIERQGDQDLHTALRQREYCLVFAPRQTGKSSLMVRTRKIISAEGVKVGIVDLQPLGMELDPDRWFNAVIHQIQRSMKIDIDFNQWIEDQGHLTPTERFRTFIDEILRKDKHGDAVIFIDEVDSVLNLPFSDDFFATLRSLYNARATEAHLKGLVIVLLGVITSSELVKSKIRTPYNIGVSISLEDFQRNRETEERLQQFLGKDSEALIKRIFYWTNGQPFLLQKLAQATARVPPTQRTPQWLDQEVERLFFRDKLEKDPHLRYIQNYLLDDLTSIRKTLRIYRQLLRSESCKYNAQSHVHNRLKLSGLARIESGKFVLRNKIYEKLFNSDWVKRHAGERKFICLQCDGENREDSEYCQSCGVKLVQRCPECGDDCKREDKYCRKCGSNLEVYYDALEILERVQNLLEEKRLSEIVNKYKDIDKKLKLRSEKGILIKKKFEELIKDANNAYRKWENLYERTKEAFRNQKYSQALEFAARCDELNPYDDHIASLKEKILRHTDVSEDGKFEQASPLNYDVFLSYHSKDGESVKTIANHLKSSFNLKPWFDQWELSGGDNWLKRLEIGLKRSKSCAIFVGENGTGPWQEQEILAALQTKVADFTQTFRIIPVLLPAAPNRKELPLFLQAYLEVDLRSGLDEKEPLLRLVCGIKGISPKNKQKVNEIFQKENAGNHKENIINNPQYQSEGKFHYPGTTLDIETNIYVNREADREVLKAILRPRAMVTLCGGRQSGKSSLISRLYAYCNTEEENLRPVIVDMQKIPKANFDSLSHLWQAMMNIVSKKIFNEDSDLSFWNHHNIEHSLLQFFKKIVFATNKKPLLICFDK